MKTQAQALTWIAQQIGKSLNMDGKYGAQCVDLPWYYQQFLGMPIQWVSSARLFWERDYGHMATKKSSPRPGDIAVWSGKVGLGHGHVALVLQVHDNGDFTSVDQNYYDFDINQGSPAAKVRHNMNHVLGFIRPAFQPEPKPQPKPAPQPAPPRPQPQPGPGGRFIVLNKWPNKPSSLWHLAEMYMGDGNRWQEIYQHPTNAAMRGQRPNPNIVHSGDRWFVPAK